MIQLKEEIYPDIDDLIENPPVKKKIKKYQKEKLMSEQKIKVNDRCPKCGKQGSVVRRENIIIKEEIPNENILIGNLKGSICTECNAIFLDGESYKIASTIINEEIQDSMTITKANITLRKYQYEWIKKHKSFNFSGFVQESIDKLIRKEKKTELPYLSP